MNENETKVTLGALRHVQDHAVEMFDNALPLISDAQANEQIARLRDDHEARASELRGVLNEMGGAPNGTLPGMEALEAEHDRLMHESSRQDEALEALLLMEEFTATQYGFAVSMDLPQDRVSMLREHLDETQRHVQELQKRVGTLPIEIAGGGVSLDHMYVDDKNPDDFDSSDALV